MSEIGIKEVLSELGNKAISFFRDNIEAQINLKDGKPFANYSYDYWLKRNNIKRGKKEKVIDFKRRTLSEWLDAKNEGMLIDTGSMSQSMMIIELDESNRVVRLGFENEEDAEKAYYHNVVGVGPNRKIRRFMALTATQKHSLEKIAIEMIEKNDFLLTSMLFNLAGSQIKKAL